MRGRCLKETFMNKVIYLFNTHLITVQKYCIKLGSLMKAGATFVNVWYVVYYLDTKKFNWCHWHYHIEAPDIIEIGAVSKLKKCNES